MFDRDMYVSSEPFRSNQPDYGDTGMMDTFAEVPFTEEPLTDEDEKLIEALDLPEIIESEQGDPLCAD